MEFFSPQILSWLISEIVKNWNSVQIPLKIGQHLCPVKAVLRNKCYNLIILSSWQTASVVTSDIRFHNYPHIHVYIASNWQCCDLKGQCGLQMASEVNSDLTFEISGLKYPHFHGHVASHSQFWDLRGHCGLQTTSKVKFDLRSKMYSLSYMFYVSLACKCFYELIDTGRRRPNIIHWPAWLHSR